MNFYTVYYLSIGKILYQIKILIVVYKGSLNINKQNFPMLSQSLDDNIEFKKMLQIYPNLDCLFSYKREFLLFSTITNVQLL